MAVDYQKIAEGVLANVGGKDNVASATHCMTRLRLTFKDKSKVNSDAIKGLTGVLGINWAGVIAIVIGAIVAYIFLSVSWYASLIPAGLSYYLLMKYLPAAAPFRKGTIFEDKAA